MVSTESRRPLGPWARVRERGDTGGRGGEGGLRHPPPSSPEPSGAGSAPGATRSSASPPSAPLWGGGLRPGAERSGGPAGMERGLGAEGGWRRPGPRRAVLEDPGGPSTVRGPPAGRVDGRGRRRRPAGSWRERGAGPLPSVQTTAPTAAPLPGLHAQLAKRRVTAAGPLARGCPVELFLKGTASVCSLKDVSWRGFFGGSESN